MGGVLQAELRIYAVTLFVQLSGIEGKELVVENEMSEVGSGQSHEESWKPDRRVEIDSFT